MSSRDLHVAGQAAGFLAQFAGTAAADVQLLSEPGQTKSL